MNKYTSEFLADIKDDASHVGDILMAGAEQYPDAYEHIKRVGRTEQGVYNHSPFLKYLIRRSALKIGSRDVIANWGEADPLELININVFCNQFAYDKEVAGYVPMYVTRSLSRSFSKVIEERQAAKIREKWNNFREHVCTIDGEEPSLIDSFDDQHLYFMKNEKTDEIKIGISIHPEVRRRQLERQHGNKITILRVVASQGRSKEKELHLRFSAYRTHGEWFEPNKELVEYIENID